MTKYQIIEAAAAREGVPLVNISITGLDELHGLPVMVRRSEGEAMFLDDINKPMPAAEVHAIDEAVMAIARQATMQQDTKPMTREQQAETLEAKHELQLQRLDQDEWTDSKPGACQ